jgi:hypothetical protein
MMNLEKMIWNYLNHYLMKNLKRMNENLKEKMRQLIEESFVIVPDRCLDFFAFTVSVVEVTIAGVESVSLLCS